MRSTSATATHDDDPSPHNTPSKQLYIRIRPSCEMCTLCVGLRLGHACRHTQTPRGTLYSRTNMIPHCTVEIALKIRAVRRKGVQWTTHLFLIDNKGSCL